MGALKAVCIAVTTYSILPVPQFQWTDESIRYSLCAFPIVGLLIGGAELLWYWICGMAGFGHTFFAVVAAAIPLILSGGIHMDGFCDTVDALASHQSRERKLEILKDPHTGVFAIIYGAVYILLSFGAYTELYDLRILAVASAGFVLSRALCVLSTLLTPNARNGGMLAAFTGRMARRAAWGITLAFLSAALLGMVFLSLMAAALCGALCVGWLFLYRMMALRQFGGVTGDTSGFFLQIAEILILFGCMAGRMVVA